MEYPIDRLYRNYQLTNQWQIEISDYGSVNEDLIFLAKSINIPTHDISFENISGRNFATEVNYPLEVTIEFLETEKMDVLTYLNNWMSQEYDPIKKVFKKGRDRIKKVQCYLYGTNKEEVEQTYTIQFVLHNVRIKTKEAYILDYETGEPLKTIGNFVCDRIDAIYPENDGEEFSSIQSVEGAESSGRLLTLGRF